MLAGEGDPDEVVAARGLAVVSDDTALIAAVDEALAAQPDVAEKIRGGKVAAAGAIVGAVMKATRGQADAKRVRELVLERCGVTHPLVRANGTFARTYCARVPFARSRGGSAGAGEARGQARDSPPPAGGWIRITRSSLGTGLPPDLFTVPIQSSPSGARVAADSRP